MTRLCPGHSPVRSRRRRACSQALDAAEHRGMLAWLGTFLLAYAGRRRFESAFCGQRFRQICAFLHRR
jgi:hypothetical protein